MLSIGQIDEVVYLFTWGHSVIKGSLIYEILNNRVYVVKLISSPKCFTYFCVNIVKLNKYM